MGHQEKRVIVSIIGNLIILFYFINHFMELDAGGHLTGDAGASEVGKQILYLIGASIVVNVVLQVVGSIIFAIVTGDSEGDDFVEDERDKLIEQKTMQFAMIFFSIGFVGSIIHLYLGQSANVTIIMIAFSMFIAHLLADFVKLFFYVRGV